MLALREFICLAVIMNSSIFPKFPCMLVPVLQIQPQMCLASLTLGKLRPRWSPTDIPNNFLFYNTGVPHQQSDVTCLMCKEQPKWNLNGFE